MGLRVAMMRDSLRGISTYGCALHGDCYGQYQYRLASRSPGHFIYMQPRPAVFLFLFLREFAKSPRTTAARTGHASVLTSPRSRSESGFMVLAVSSGAFFHGGSASPCPNTSIVKVVAMLCRDDRNRYRERCRRRRDGRHRGFNRC